MCKSWKAYAIAALLASSIVLNVCRAQSALLDEVHTVAAADVAVPVEHSIQIGADGTYQVTLVDLGAALQQPAPLSSVKLAITSGGSVVGTPLTQAGSAQFSATKGAYVIHVIGLPNPANPGSGPIGIQVTNLADNTRVAAFSDTLALPATGVPLNQGVLADSFTVPATGSYQLALTDFQFPQALGTLTLAITEEGGGLITTLPGGTDPVSLQQGVTYSIFAVGESADASVKAGLYAVSVTPAGGGGAVYSSIVPVGAVELLGAPVLTAGSYTLSYKDLLYPSALASLGAIVTLNGQAVAQVTASGGQQTFTTTADTYQVFALGVPQAPAANGSYSMILKPVNGSPVLSVARAVSVSGGSISAYSFDTTVTTAGSYALDLADFGLSAQFTSLSAAVVQNGGLVGNGQGAGTWLTSAGSMSVTPGVGPATLLVFAQPGTGGSLFGIDLTPSGSSTALFATTQGVGQLFGTHGITVPTAGSYTVSVADVGFPTNLQTLAVAVTQGANRLGAIFTGGLFNFTATAGTTYFVNIIAQAGTTTADHAGTYSINVAPTPPAPVVNLSSSAPSVTSGGTVNLSWSSQNVTSCSGTSTPAGVWSTSALSGNAQATGAITTSTTFTLKCTGAGGDQTATVTVSVSSPASGGGGHGGGGAVGLELLAVLSGLTLVRLLHRVAM